MRATHAAQYHIFQKLRPEFEVNNTFSNDGTQNGKKQTFLTPGPIFGRFKLHGHLVMAFGAGFQIAATHFHTYNHAPGRGARFSVPRRTSVRRLMRAKRAKASGAQPFLPNNGIAPAASHSIRKTLTYAVTGAPAICRSTYGKMPP
ncbi:MAG: hypothetical protein ABSH32_34440 [Bryobacteraceae bacterium]